MTKELQKSIDDIVLSIKRGVVIPIVGYDMLFNEFQSNTGKDFLKLLIKKHAENDNEEFKNKIFEKENTLTGYELINSYYHNLPNSIAKNNFKLSLSQTIKNERLNWELIPESFRKLVSIKYFKFFINGTFTNTLALAYNSYRGKGNNVTDIISSYSVLGYHPTEPDRIPKIAPLRFKVDLERPLIYNLCGTHDDESAEYLLTDADYIELIYDLIQNKEEKFTNLLSYLNKAELLFLGCNFPDWFFRFFIRVCVGDRLDSVSTIERKTVIDSLNNIDSSRSVFINHYKIQALNMDCNTLIDEIFKSFWKDKEGSSHILTDEANNNVFISYCRQDEQVAKDIASQFDEKFIEYFLDESDLEPGDQLNDKITQAIDKCCLFLPIISTNIQEASRYIWREWQYAITKSSEVWPVFKEFVDRDMLLPVEYGITAELRDRFLNRNVTIGAALNGGVENEIAKRGNLLEEKKLRDIKKKQYDSRVCGKRK